VLPGLVDAAAAFARMLSGAAPFRVVLSVS